VDKVYIYIEGGRERTIILVPSTIQK